MDLSQFKTELKTLAEKMYGQIPLKSIRIVVKDELGNDYTHAFKYSLK